MTDMETFILGLAAVRGLPPCRTVRVLGAAGPTQLFSTT